MLIGQYHIRLESPPWEPGSAQWSAFAQLEADLSPVLAYLNAALKGAILEPSVPALFWRTDGRLVCFRPHEIAISNLDDRGEAQAAVERVIQMVNDVWERRGSIQPSLTRRKRPAVLEIYKLLPRSNCGTCGHPTCLTFALQLAMGQRAVSECPPLMTAELKDRRKRLLATLEGVDIGGG